MVGAGWAGVSVGAGDRFCGAEVTSWPLLATEDDGASGGVGSGVLLAKLSLAEGVAVAVSGAEAGAALAVVFCCVTVVDSWALSWLVVCASCVSSAASFLPAWSTRAVLT